MKPLHPAAVRCEPYSDGHWFFAYDPEHVDALKELGAHDALLGFASGADADRRVARVAEEGLALACETAQDWIAVDILVGKKLSSAQKKKAEWLDPRSSFLRIRSGRLRIESLNSLSFGPDDPDADGCEIDVPAGEYDVVVRRVAWELMDDVDSPDDRPEVPTAVMELQPVGKKGPKAKAASLGLAEARGEVGTWLIGGRVEDGVFRGETRPHEYRDSAVHLNLRGAHGESMGLRFGDTLIVTAGDVTVSAPFTGYVGLRAIEAGFGHDWYEEHLEGVEILSGFTPFRASTPWLVDVEGSGLPTGVPVEARVGEPWCEAPAVDRDAARVEKGQVHGSIVYASPGSLILDFGWEKLRAAKVQFEDLLELVVEGRSRSVYLDASRREFREEARERFTDEGEPGEVPLLLREIVYWDDPELRLAWLTPLVGDEHHLDLEPGTEVSLRVAEGGAGEEPEPPTEPQVGTGPLAGIRGRLADATPVPLKGGSVSIPLEELGLLLDLAEKCATGFDAGVSVAAGGNGALVAAAPKIEDVTAETVGDRLDVHLGGWAGLWKRTRKAADVLAGARDGTALELMTAKVHGELGPQADQLYRGRVEGGAFVIEEAHPRMGCADLEEALQLMRDQREQKLRVRDEEELSALLDELGDSIWFAFGPPEIAVEGLELTVEPSHAVEGVAQYLFIRRHGSVWNVEKMADWHRTEAGRAKRARS